MLQSIAATHLLTQSSAETQAPGCANAAGKARGISDKQQQEQSSQNLGLTFSRSLYFFVAQFKCRDNY